MIKSKDILLSIETVYYQDKKQAIIDCLKTGKGFSIRELRVCVSNKIAVSEKIVSKILHELEKDGTVIKISKRWYLADFSSKKKVKNNFIRSIVKTIEENTLYRNTAIPR